MFIYKNMNKKSEVSTHKELNDKIKKNDMFVLYYASWCGPCQAITNEWNNLDHSKKDCIACLESSNIKPELSKANNTVVDGYPTLVFYKNDSAQWS